MMIPALGWLLLACTGPGTPDVSTPTSAASPPASSPAAAPDPADEAQPGVKAPGQVMIKTESEAAADSAALLSCVSDCVHRNQMRSVSAQQIEQECHEGCVQVHPIEQVQVVPDGPVDPDAPAVPDAP